MSGSLRTKWYRGSSPREGTIQVIDVADDLPFSLRLAVGHAPLKRSSGVRISEGEPVQHKRYASITQRQSVRLNPDVGGSSPAGMPSANWIVRRMQRYSKLQRKSLLRLILAANHGEIKTRGQLTAGHSYVPPEQGLRTDRVPSAGPLSVR
jgi:hypothetical protein